MSRAAEFLRKFISPMKPENCPLGVLEVACTAQTMMSHTIDFEEREWSTVLATSSSETQASHTTLGPHIF